MSNLHAADDSFLGYYYQGMYALVKLLDANDSDKISIETQDDVFLEGKEKKLIQLKHSLDPKGNLTEKNVGLWKTLRIWSNMVLKDNIDEKTYFIFVTPLNIKKDSLMMDFVNENNDRSELIKLLVTESKRVITEREDAVIKNKKIPHNERIEGCKAFINLSDQQRNSLINKISINIKSFNVKEINSEIEKRIKNIIPVNIRSYLIERLIEWWDRRIVLGLLKKQAREVSKAELTQQISSIYSSFQENNLPDDFSEVDFLDGDENDELMKVQIDLVKGGENRKARAAMARWKAINQREKWITEDIIYTEELNRFDNRLLQTWKDSFEPMQDDLSEAEEKEIKKAGLDLLDWSHKNAHLEIESIRSNWKKPFLVQGTFQELSNELKVGWHPKYKDLLKDSVEEDEK